MDESIGIFCNSLAAFCNHLQAGCDALKLSVDRRPIPLDSASTSFMQCLNRRVSSTCADLNLLESMTLDTVSFEELLGHCTEVYNKNKTDILALQDRLVCMSSSYVPSADIEEEELEDLSPDVGTSTLPSNKLEDDLLLDDCLSLKNFGLSEACLATIASEADDSTEEKKVASQSGANIFTEIKGEEEDDIKVFEDRKSLINVSRDDYENLPKHMKSLVSWEDLLVAVEKINSYLLTSSSKLNTFPQDEITSLGLGYKARSYILLLINMKCIIVETVNGVIHYRITSMQ